jgi:hypothetical protein
MLPAPLSLDATNGEPRPLPSARMPDPARDDKLAVGRFATDATSKDDVVGARSSNVLVAGTTGLSWRVHVWRLLGEHSAVSGTRRPAVLARAGAMQNHVRHTDGTRFPDETWRSHDTAPPDPMLVDRHEAAP